VLGVRVVVFNATFNNISVISWRSVLLVEVTEYPEKTTDLPQVTDILLDSFEVHVNRFKLVQIKGVARRSSRMCKWIMADI